MNTGHLDANEEPSCCCDQAQAPGLIGFGLDSVIEVASALALSWQFSARGPERREHLPLWIIAVSFFTLAAFVTAGAARSLTGRGEAQHSIPGSCPGPSAAPGWNTVPRRQWLTPGQTLLCTYLFAVLLAGWSGTARWAGGGPTPAPHRPHRRRHGRRTAAHHRRHRQERRLRYWSFPLRS